MSFLDSLKALFGGNKAKQQAAGPIRKYSKQVYEAPERNFVPPAWSNGLNKTMLINEIPKHVVCKFSPNFGYKKIMSTQVGPDGNLMSEYEGIAGDCGAIKNFGKQVANRDGYFMPYRYANVTTAFRMCCDNPKRCPFYLCAVGEAADMTAKLKKM